MITVANCFWLYSKVFCPWETCRLRSFSTRHLQAPKNNLILLCISAAYRRTRKKHASVPATYLRWRSRSTRSTSVCSSCSTQSRKMEQNESGLPSTCHASRPRAYARPASYSMATGRYPFRSSMKLSNWRPVRPLPSMNEWMFSNIAWNPAALSSGCAPLPFSTSTRTCRSSRISSGSAVLTRVAAIRAK